MNALRIFFDRLQFDLCIVSDVNSNASPTAGVRSSTLRSFSFLIPRNAFSSSSVMSSDGRFQTFLLSAASKGRIEIAPFCVEMSSMGIHTETDALRCAKYCASQCHVKPDRCD